MRTKTRFTLVALGFVLQACGGESGADTPSAGDKYQPGSVEPTSLISAAKCKDDAQFDFLVSGKGLSAWNGRRAAAAAIEPNLFKRPTSVDRRALLSGSISMGTFSLSCLRSLHETYQYPSFALYIDVDGDGRCGRNDVGYQLQLYGWRETVQEEIPDASFWHPTAELSPPLGKDGKDFCTGYFY